MDSTVNMEEFLVGRPYDWFPFKSYLKSNLNVFCSILSHLGKQKIMTRTHAFGYFQSSVTFDHIFLLLVLSEFEMSLNHECEHSEILGCLGFGQMSAHHLMSGERLFLICCAEIPCHKTFPCSLSRICPT